MKQSRLLNNTVYQSLSRIALAIATVVAVALPLGYFVVAYSYESQRVQVQADIGAHWVTQLAQQHPRTWVDETQAAGIGNRLANGKSRFLIESDNGRVLAVIGDEPAAPTIRHRASIFAEGVPIGTVQIIRSLRPTLVHAAIAALLGAALGISLYLAFRVVPMRTLREAQAQVETSQQALRAEIRAKERAMKKAEHTGQAIKHLAYHDLLTDLPNRSLLKEQMQAAIADMRRSGKNLALITLDLDCFKEINDTLGHHKGDLVIREVGARLRRCLKKTDLIARLGGDEFAVMLTDIDDLSAVVDIANRILEALEQPFMLDGYAFDVSASLGIVAYPEHGNDAKTLLQRADVAMYLAKDSNKDFVIYSPDMDPNSLGHLTLKGELRSAIEQGKLMVYYQPKIDIKTGYISGAEALVRWTHPQRGCVGPDQFIPLAEQTGLIHPMTGLVFNISLHQCALWRQDRLDIGVAVNISVHSLHDSRLPERIMEMLTTWNIPPHKLTLEVTESAIMAEPQRALKVLSELDEMGVHISIDDYGTGYSSLSYLKQLPVQEIKIDRSFVKDMVNNDNDAVIVRATIDMAHDLGLRVTAEGIEDQATWDALADLGCDQAQGFYMSKPLPPSELADWIRESQWGLREKAG